MTTTKEELLQFKMNSEKRLECIKAAIVEIAQLLEKFRVQREEEEKHLELVISSLIKTE